MIALLNYLPSSGRVYYGSLEPVIAVCSFKCKSSWTYLKSDSKMSESGQKYSQIFMIN